MVRRGRTRPVSSSVFPATRSRRPSGKNAIRAIGPPAPRHVIASGLAVASQNLTVWSELVEASRRPSGLKATQVTFCVWPRSVKGSCPPAISQTLMAPSAPPRRSAAPSGLNATLRPSPGGPPATASRSSVRGVPDLAPCGPSSRSRSGLRRGDRPTPVSGPPMAGDASGSARRSRGSRGSARPACSPPGARRARSR